MTPDKIRSLIEEWRNSNKFKPESSLHEATIRELEQACTIIEAMLPYAEKALGDCVSFNCKGCPGCLGIVGKETE